MTNAGATNFQRFYEADDTEWGGSSGLGSDPFYVLPYRHFIESFIRLNNIKSVIDIGCGDWTFSRYINYHDVRYYGYDVVEKVVERNTALFGSDTTKFDVMPSDFSVLPDADLLIMKDVLQHLPDAELFRHKSLFARYKRNLITNSYRKLNTEQNVEITDYGAFRCLDLTAAPYNYSGSYVLEFNTPLWEESRTLMLS